MTNKAITQLVAPLAARWGQALLARRRACGLTQAALAELTGMSQQAVWQFEHGKRIPLDRTKVVLAAALDTTPGELFTWPAMPELLDLLATSERVELAAALSPSLRPRLRP